jgi:hypothetical protein
LDDPQVQEICRRHENRINEKLSAENHYLKHDDLPKDARSPLEWAQEVIAHDPIWLDTLGEDIADNVVEGTNLMGNDDGKDLLPEVPEARPEREDLDDVKTRIPSKDTYIGMELQLPRYGDDHWKKARVKDTVKDNRGMPVGRPNNNPILDTRMYEVEFHDGHLEQMTASNIAECMYVCTGR